jgi:hypothetical protein
MVRQKVRFHMRRLSVFQFIVVAAAGALVMFAEAPAAAQVSTLDAHRTRASALFNRRLDAASALRTELADDWKKYERACRGKVTTGRGIGVAFVRSELVWFVQSLQIDNETTPECRMLATGMKTRSQHVTRELEQIDEDGRRNGIYPGVVRELKRRYGFD